MFLINARECFEKGLLAKTNPDRDLALKSVRQAEYFLEKTQTLVNKGEDEIAILPLYNSFFHAARALLFLDGVKEKSHFCIARYLEDYYVKNNLLESSQVAVLDDLRGIRHEMQYSLKLMAIDEDILSLIGSCGSFINRVEELTDKKHKDKKNKN